MIELVVAVLFVTLPALVAGLFCYQLAALRVAVDLLGDLPAQFHHRSWGLRVFRHEGLIEVEVGWIDRLSWRIRRP